MTSTSSPRPRRRRRLAGALGAALLLVLLAGAWAGYDAWRVKGQLEAAASDITDAKRFASAGDLSALASASESAADHASSARAAAHNPVLSLVGTLPWFDADVTAVQTVTVVVDGLATDVLPTLVDALDAVDPQRLTLEGGALDLEPISAVGPTVVAAHERVTDSLARLEAIDTAQLRSVVAQPVADLEQQLLDVAGTTATAARAVQLLPPMLGGEGTRNYLLLVQNNAEVRSAGGLAGTLLHLRATDGALEIVAQRSALSMPELAEPILPLTEDEQRIYGDALGTFPANVTFTPDFDRSAELITAMWRDAGEAEVDGVMAIDPVALAGLLGATGPVTLADGSELTADNAVDVLLNQVYREIEVNAAQDAFFADATGRVFAALTTGAGDTGAALTSLAASAREGRVLVWSAHDDEHDLLAGTVLSGELRGTQDGDRPLVGVYLNDGSAAKMSYYLRNEVSLTATECTADGVQALTARATLTSTAPADVADNPYYLTGVILDGGQVRTNLYVYAPDGGEITAVRVDGEPYEAPTTTHDGLPVMLVTTQLAPGASVTVEVDLRGGPGLTGAPALRQTPLAKATPAVVGASACSG